MQSLRSLNAVTTAWGDGQELLITGGESSHRGSNARGQGSKLNGSSKIACARLVARSYEGQLGPVHRMTPWLVNTASRPSIEAWFVIKYFNSLSVLIIPLKIEERPFTCTSYSPGLILDGNHLDLQQGGQQGDGPLSIGNNGCWFGVVFSIFQLNYLAHPMGQEANCGFAWMDTFHQNLLPFQP